MTRFRKPAILALAVLLLLACFPAWAETAESAERTLIRLVNEDRARYGLNALTVDPALCSVARIKAPGHAVRRLLRPHVAYLRRHP